MYPVELNAKFWPSYQLRYEFPHAMLTHTSASALDIAGQLKILHAWPVPKISDMGLCRVYGLLVFKDVWRHFVDGSYVVSLLALGYRDF
jgi:hypothetical protein